MRIGLEHIDSKIVAAMRERLCAPGVQFLRDNIRWGDPEDYSLVRSVMDRTIKRSEKRSSREEERIAFHVHRQREKMALQRGCVAAIAPVVVGAALGMLSVQLFAGILWLGIAVGVLAWAGGAAAGFYWTRQATSAHELFYEVTIAEFLSVVPLLTLTPLEAAYCHLLIQVCDRDPNQEGRRAVRRHIARIKEFVELGRQLDALGKGTKEADLAARIDAERGDLVETIKAIEAALCVILVVPSPAGDTAAELIETSLLRFRSVVEAFRIERAAELPEKGNRRREKVS